MSEIADQQAAMRGRWGDKTLCDALADTAAQYGPLPAFSDRDDGGPWQTLTWADTRQKALELAAAFVELGLKPGEKVAFMLPNCVEHVLADLGVLHAGGVPVTFYATSAPEQIAFMASNCEAAIAVLDGAGELARWQQVLSQLPSLRTVIVRDAAACPAEEQYLSWAALSALGGQRLASDPDAVMSRIAAVRPDDPVTLLYTSGTTGNPKGVIITHANALYEVATAETGGIAPMHVRWVSYLPMAHIAERMLTLYLGVCHACDIYFCHDATRQLVATLGAVKPTAFFGVPRIYEKIMAGIQALMAAEQDEAKRAAVSNAMATGLEYVRSTQYGQTTPD